MANHSKPPGEKFVLYPIRGPRALWRKVEALAGIGGRSRFIRRSVEIVLDDPALTERALRYDAAAPERPSP